MSAPRIPCLSSVYTFRCDPAKCPLTDCIRPRMKTQPIERFEFPQGV